MITPLIRRNDWALRLDALVTERAERPFGFGTQDCALFGADAILAQTDVDLAAPFRGVYADRKGALRLLMKNGGLHSILARLLPRVAVAAEGDIVLLPDGGMKRAIAVGVRLGNGIVCPGDRGLNLIHASAALSAWKVG